MTDVFDYVIVGAGSAGSVLANRLCEDGRTTVCVLEAGPSDNHPWIHIPAGFIKIKAGSQYMWDFETEPGEPTGGRRISVRQGRTLGGSSSVNGLVYNRGQRQDYDMWADLGNRGWGWRDVLPYFRRSEDRIGVDPDGDPTRGRGGGLKVTDLDWHHPLVDAFIDGVKDLGIPHNPDHNDGEQAGVGRYQRTIYRGKRWSTARGFLKPAMRQFGDRLDVRTKATAARITFDGRRANGVDYFSGDATDQLHSVRAAREVIVCAGAINSPRLLQISGLGAPELLKKIGIDPVAQIAGVGENFQDHYAIRMVARVDRINTINDRVRMPRIAIEALRWAAGRPSVLGLQPSLAHVFWQSNDSLERPDLQFTFTPASYKDGTVGLLNDFPGMTCGVWQHRPESRGYVRAQSSSPFESPQVQPNYLGVDADRRALVAGIRLARRFISTPALAAFGITETHPGSDTVSDDDILGWARDTGSTVYHVVGTCRMGPDDDPTAVVDDQLRVRGTEGLRVVDASIMPAVTSGNTNAPTIMIAEKAADLIRGRTPPPPAAV